jgi:hypothetical protein
LVLLEEKEEVITLSAFRDSEHRFFLVAFICIHSTNPSILTATAGAPCAITPDKFVKFKFTRLSVAIMSSNVVLMVFVFLSVTKEAISSVILQFLSTPPLMDKDG